MDITEVRLVPESVTPSPCGDPERIEEHNQLYQNGADRIRPYLVFHGEKSLSADSETARDEIREGISLLQKALGINRANWSAHWLVGKAYQAMHESVPAWRSFAQAFALQRENVDVAREFMHECLMLGNTTEALRAAEHAVALRPKDPGLVANLALARLVAGEIADALEAVRQSLELAPDDRITRNLENAILAVQSGKRPSPRTLADLQRV